MASRTTVRETFSVWLNSLSVILVPAGSRFSMISLRSPVATRWPSVV